MQLLYPKSRQFPFDDACEQIVRALHARNWKVPGFTVTFSYYGSGAQKLRYVSTIVSDQSAIDLGQHDIKLYFCRVQGRLSGGPYNDIAAVNEVRIGSRALRVYEDESGPSYNVYVGDNWERDRSTYWDRYNAKLNNEPRLCVRYSGRSGYRNSRATTLEYVKDHREYAPMGADPQTYDTREVMEGVRAHLQSVILPAIVAYAPAATIDEPTEPPPIPFPADVGPFFAYGEPRDVRRIETGKKSLDALEPADRYALNGGGKRLAPTYIKSGPDLPEVAYDGFLWCGVVGTAGWRVPGHMRGSFDNQLIKVTPKNARGVFVADNAVYEKLREKRSKEIKGERDMFTDEEVNSFLRARACTIVPIAEYKGGFEEPIYLINRELWFDEVEVMGPRPE